jgi:CMP-N,N'-diacetyllegionaminic acid synthase
MPLIAWSINAAKSSKLIDQVIVSTDCNSILATAKKFGAIALKRPSDLADDFTSAYEVARYVYLNQIEQKPNYVVLLQPTSPLREKDLIDNGIKAIQEDNSIDRVIEVNSLRLFSGKVMKNIWIPDYPEDKRSQDIHETFFPSGRLYIYRAKTAMEKHEAEGNTKVILGNYERNVNIDYECDFEKLDFVYRNHEFDYIHLLDSRV